MAVNTRYSLDLFCWDVPAESRLHSIVKQVEKGGHYCTPFRKRYVKDGKIALYLTNLESYREDIARCSNAYVSIAYYPNHMLAECATLIPNAHLRSLAVSGVGLEVAVYPFGNDNTRYGGKLFFVVAVAGEAGADKNVNLLPSIRRSLRERGLKPVACFDYDASFAETEAFASACIPENHEPAVFTLNKYLGESLYPSYVLSKDIIAKLAENSYDLELYFNFPRRRARKLRVKVH